MEAETTRPRDMPAISDREVVICLKYLSSYIFAARLIGRYFSCISKIARAYTNKSKDFLLYYKYQGGTAPLDNSAFSPTCLTIAIILAYPSSVKSGEQREASS
jgi:hypothetical protein